MRIELKLLRIKHQLTQQELAKELGVSCATYNLIESGQRKGSIEVWTKIQQLFNISDADVWSLYSKKEYAVNPQMKVEKR